MRELWGEKGGAQVTPTQRISTLRRWLGGPGRPVEQAEADRRAAVCLACPRHEALTMEEVTRPLAQVLRRAMELKADMKLRVEGEERLHTCGVCLCWMPTKVWCSLEFAREVTPDWQQFPDNCWLHGRRET